MKCTQGREASNQDGAEMVTLKASQEPLKAAPEAVNRVGVKMEIQACDDDCAMSFCTGCVWNLCTVVADYGRTCNVTLDEGGTLCEDVIAHRFLRMPAAANGRKRKAT